METLEPVKGNPHYNFIKGDITDRSSINSVFESVLPLDRTDLFFTEQTPLHTSSPYSTSKASADLMVLAYHRTYKLDVTISRRSNNYDAYHCPENLILRMTVNALNDKPLPIYGKGENLRD